MKTLILLFSILISAFDSPKDSRLWFGKQIGIDETCPGKDINFPMRIYTDFDSNVQIYCFNTDKGDCTIYYEGKAISKSDTLKVIRGNYLEITVKCKLKNANKLSSLSFKSSLPQFQENEIKIKYGETGIKIFDENDGSIVPEHFIDISKACQDTIKLWPPGGGTESYFALFSDSVNFDKEYKSITYSADDTNKYLSITKRDVGRYYVKFRSCYTGANFWLNIK